MFGANNSALSIFKKKKIESVIWNTFFLRACVWYTSRWSSNYAFVNQGTCKPLKAFVNHLECLKKSLGTVYFLTVSRVRNSPADINADW